MRRSLIDHDFNPTLCALLEVSGGGGGGSVPPGGGPPVEMLYVAPGGNDTTGNGSLALPYLTIGKAESVGAPLATLLKPYVILVAPGTYAETPLLYPYLTISGLDPASPPLITGAPSIAPSFPASAPTGLNNLAWSSAVPVNFGSAAGPTLTLTNNDFKAGLSVTGAGGGITAVLKSNLVGGALSFTDVSTVGTYFNAFSGPVAITATNFNAAWNSTGDVMSDGLSVDAAVAKTNIVEALGSSVSGGSGLTLTGAGVSYTGTEGAIPSVVTTSGGAPAPITIAASGGPSQGDWSDGNVTISVPTNLTRDMYYKTLTVNSTLSTKGYRIYADVVTGTGIIDNSGANAVTITPGAGASSGTLGGGTSGGAGVFSNLGSGAMNGAPGTNQAGGFGNESGAGGTGGAAGIGTGGGGGSLSVLPATVGGIRAQPASLTGQVEGSTVAATFGGTGGGSGGSNGATGGTSGAGGGGAGPIIIATRVLSSSLTIRANGGTGGAAIGDGNVGGGAGGGAAPIVISANDKSGFTGTIESNGGTGGAPIGTGGVGGAGANASIIQLVT